MGVERRTFVLHMHQLCLTAQLPVELFFRWRKDMSCMLKVMVDLVDHCMLAHPSDTPPLRHICSTRQLLESKSCWLTFTLCDFCKIYEFTMVVQKIIIGSFGIAKQWMVNLETCMCMCLYQ